MTPGIKCKHCLGYECFDGVMTRMILVGMNLMIILKVISVLQLLLRLGGKMENETVYF